MRSGNAGQIPDQLKSIKTNKSTPFLFESVTFQVKCFFKKSLTSDEEKEGLLDQDSVCDVTGGFRQSKLRDTQLEEREEVLPSPPMLPLWQSELQERLSLDFYPPGAEQDRTGAEPRGFQDGALTG